MKNDRFYYELKDGTKIYVGPFKIWYKNKITNKNSHFEVTATNTIDSYECHNCGNNIYTYQMNTYPNKKIKTPNYGVKGIWECPQCHWWNYKLTKKDIEKYEQNKGN